MTELAHMMPPTPPTDAIPAFTEAEGVDTRSLPRS